MISKSDLPVPKGCGMKRGEEDGEQMFSYMLDLPPNQ